MRICGVFAVFGLVAIMAANKSERQQQQQQQQLQTLPGYYYDGRSQSVIESTRTHHGGHKLKKMKKQKLLQCLLALGHERRRRRDTTASGTGRFFIPFVVQNTNVNVGDGGGGGTYSDPPQYESYESGCMQFFLGSTGGSSTENSGTDSRNGLYTDWYRYARQFNRNFVRPLYRLF